MKRPFLFGCAVLALCSTLVVAQDGPTSLLPPGFDDPTPAPTPTPTPTPRPTATRAPSVPSAPAVGSAPVVQPIPSAATPSVVGPIADSLPSLDELEALDPDDLDELLGLKPKFDIPAAARRSTERIGILDESEGGLPARSLGKQPASIVRAALAGIRGPLVSRWGHILMRRALASRLMAPNGMDPVEFAALRVGALNQIGEYAVARSLAQDVDTGNWDDALTDGALQSYIATTDIVGACPVVQIKGGERDDPQWQLLQSICYAFAGQGARSQANLNKAFRNKIAPAIDVLLAQRYAGSAGRGRRAVNLEWDGVNELTPWRYALATALGAEIPDSLLEQTSPYLRLASASNPSIPVSDRIEGANLAARRGIFSSSALVDIYSASYEQSSGDVTAAMAGQLREAYVAENSAARLAAIRSVWDSADRDYSGFVLTAYAAARIAPGDELADASADLIASMLTAGLDADALTWAPFALQGSQSWALLSLAQPVRPNPVAESQIDEFVSGDESHDQRKSGFLVAGLAGLGRMEPGTRASFDSRLDLDLMRKTKWSQLITRAAEVNNRPLVAYLAAVGMQGNGWDKMTARHLFHIVSALNRVGLSGEARMIAAEAVARG